MWNDKNGYFFMKHPAYVRIVEEKTSTPREHQETPREPHAKKTPRQETATPRKHKRPPHQETQENTTRHKRPQTQENTTPGDPPRQETPTPREHIAKKFPLWNENFGEKKKKINKKKIGRNIN